MSRCHRTIILLALTSLLALTASASPKAGEGQGSSSAAQVSALLVSATNAPLRVLGSDGMEHLEYDLIITNAFSAPVTLTTIDVVAPDGRRLLRLEGDALARNTQTVFFNHGPPISQIPASGVVATGIDLVVPPGAVPARISHQIAYELPPDAPGLTLIDSTRVTGPELVVDPRPPLVIAPPLRGDGWFNGSGCCDPAEVHRAIRLVVDGARYVKPEMFAIDWVRLQGGRMSTGGGAQNEQHFAFGADVVSVADGTVVSVRDDMPDETPNQPPVAVKHSADYAGNHVVIRILPDVWAVYAHLQLGSIAVRAGERVTTGQPVGRLGNSGNSTAPHLHFQLSDVPDVLTSSSLPFVIDRYTLAGTVDPEGAQAVFTDPTAPAELPIDGSPQAQSGTYPLFLTVADFR